jgi:UDP-N-acetylmuramoylalanine--D-glutamate ligase
VLANRAPGVRREGDRLLLDDEPLCPVGALPLIGRHNLDNAALALQAAILLGHGARELAGTLASFRALPHRLEPVAQVGGVRYINDSISTSPWATLAALDALSASPVVLIAGGQPRPADWQPVLDWVRTHRLEALLTIPDNGPDIARRFASLAGDRVGRAESLESLAAAVDRAAALAPAGGVVLLSPGAPSFSRFRDFEQRGEWFRDLVGALERTPAAAKGAEDR